MEAYRGEDEQLAALKRWWKENGNSLLIGIGLALFVVFGWKAYEQHTRSTAEAASNQYQALLQSLAQTDMSNQDAVAKIQVQAHDLKNEHGGSVYGQYAALILAKLAVDAGEAAQAEEQLRWVIEQKPVAEIERVAKARLARVLTVQDRHADALALLDVPKDDAFYVYFQELRGDILLETGEREKAREAYQLAQEQAGKAGQGPQPLLEMKLADLAAQAQ